MKNIKHIRQIDKLLLCFKKAQTTTDVPVDEDLSNVSQIIQDQTSVGRLKNKLTENDIESLVFEYGKTLTERTLLTILNSRILFNLVSKNPFATMTALQNKPLVQSKFVKVIQEAVDLDCKCVNFVDDNIKQQLDLSNCDRRDVQNTKNHAYDPINSYERVLEVLKTGYSLKRVNIRYLESLSALEIYNLSEVIKEEGSAEVIEDLMNSTFVEGLTQEQVLEIYKRCFNIKPHHLFVNNHITKLFIDNIYGFSLEQQKDLIFNCFGTGHDSYARVLLKFLPERAVYQQLSPEGKFCVDFFNNLSLDEKCDLFVKVVGDEDSFSIIVESPHWDSFSIDQQYRIFLSAVETSPYIDLYKMESGENNIWARTFYDKTLSFFHKLNLDQQSKILSGLLNKKYVTIGVMRNFFYNWPNLPLEKRHEIISESFKSSRYITGSFLETIMEYGLLKDFSSEYIFNLLKSTIISVPEYYDIFVSKIQLEKEQKDQLFALAVNAKGITNKATIKYLMRQKEDKTFHDISLTIDEIDKKIFKEDKFYDINSFCNKFFSKDIESFMLLLKKRSVLFDFGILTSDNRFSNTEGFLKRNDFDFINENYKNKVFPNILKKLKFDPKLSKDYYDAVYYLIADQATHTDDVKKLIESLPTKNKLAEKAVPLKHRIDVIDGFTFEILEKGDNLGLILGNLTGCCQVLGGAGEECMYDGFVNPYANFLCVRDESGSIIAQSWLRLGQQQKLVMKKRIKNKISQPTVIGSLYLDNIEANAPYDQHYLEVLQRENPKRYERYYELKEMIESGGEIDSKILQEWKSFLRVFDYKKYGRLQNAYIQYAKMLKKDYSLASVVVGEGCGDVAFDGIKGVSRVGIDEQIYGHERTRHSDDEEEDDDYYDHNDDYEGIYSDLGGNNYQIANKNILLLKYSDFLKIKYFFKRN